MAVRSRRARYLVLAVFIVTAFLLYTRSNTSIDDYRSYAEKTYENAVGGTKDDSSANGVGGGAVLRTSKPGDEDKHEAEDKAANPLKIEERPVHKTTAVATAEETKAAPERIVDAESSSSPKAVSTPSPTPVRQSQSYEAWRAQQGLTYDDELPIEVGEGRVEVEKPLASTSAIHWKKLPEHFPVTSTIQLPTSEASAIPKVQHKFKASEGKGADTDRLTVIKMAATHAWYGYREKAWGHDEIMPVSGSYKNPFNAWGATLVDALDTLYIMGMHAEFEEAVEYVKTIDFTTSPRADIPLFETTIRYLGGLLAAYDVSGGKSKVLLDKAFELGEVLYSAFDTPNRMPVTYYQWKPTFASNPHRSGNRVVLAELGSLSMEFTRLAQLTKEPKFYDAIARITSELEAYQNNTRLPGMWPTYIDASGCGKPAQIQSTHIDQSPPKIPPAADSYLVENQPVKVDVNDEVLKQAEKTLNEKHQNKQAGTVGSGDEYYQAAAQAKKEGGVVGKITGFGNPIEEGTLVDPAVKAEILGTGPNPVPASQGGIVGKVRVEDDSVKKVKRQLEGVMHAETSAEDAQSSSNSTLHTEAQRQLLPNPIGQQPAKTGIDPCVPQGLGSPSKHGQESFTLAGMSDSTYEYLPKMHLLLEGRAEEYRSMYLASADAAIEKLIYRPMIEDEDREILAAGDMSIMPNLTASGSQGPDIETFKPVGSHLVCFAGGMFALGGVIFDRPEDVEIGKKLTDGCIWAYNVTATGIMPEEFYLANCEGDWREGDECPWNKTRYYEELDPYRDVRTKVPTVVDLPTLPTLPNVPPPVLSGKDVPDDQLNKRQIDPDEFHLAPKLQPPTHTTTTKTVPDAASLPNLPPPPPIYTPPPPLSHEEFVRNKIEDERLPAGFTRISSKNYILRPEAIESVFYLWRITGEQYWRDRAWEMFTAVQSHTGTVWGNSAIDDVTKGSPEFKDSEESFWLAETLKYFYLIFEDPDKWSLDDWVLNTEAHFFKRTG